MHDETTQSAADLTPKHVGAELFIGSGVALVIGAVLAWLGDFSLRNPALIVAVTAASVLSMFVAHYYGRGLAALVGEQDAPGIRYNLTFGSVCAVVTVCSVCLVHGVVGI